MVFLDSGYLIALLHTGDQYRTAALEWATVLEVTQEPLLTTEFCLIELVDFLSDKGRRELARRLVRELRAGVLVTIAPCSSQLLDRGLQLHSQRDDKTWSLTDCISFIVMEDLGVTEAMTFDEDFRQAGVRPIPLD